MPRYTVDRFEGTDWVVLRDEQAKTFLVPRRWLPADVRTGDLEALPFGSGAFHAVVAVNSIFYADDMSAAMRELVRVARPKGRVVVTAWGPPERCEFLRAVMPALGPLLPPPPPGAASAHRGTLAEPGALAALLREAGLRVLEEGQVSCPFVFPSAEASWRANSSAGVNQAAIACSGEAAVRAVYAKADRTHMRPDGSVRYDNVFLWIAGEKP